MASPCSASCSPFACPAHWDAPHVSLTSPFLPLTLLPHLPSLLFRENVVSTQHVAVEPLAPGEQGLQHELVLLSYRSHFPNEKSFPDLPGGSVVKTALPVQGCEFKPWWGNEVPACCMDSKRKKEKKKAFMSFTATVFIITQMWK